MRFTVPAAAARRRTLGVALALALAACTAPNFTVEDPAARLPNESNRVFGVVFEQIRERYLRPVAIGDLAFDGLQAVAATDPTLTIRRAGDTFEVSAPGRSTWRGTVSTPDEPRAWGRAVVGALEAARDRSAPLREKTVEQTYQIFFDAALRPLDAYTRYSGQDSARESRAQRDGFGGIGVTIDTSTSGVIRVASVVPDTPAARGGLRVDDQIAAIGGETTEGMSQREVVQRLRGAVGAPVAIEVRRVGLDAPLPISLVREHIVPQTVTWRREGDVAVIRMTSFNQRTTENLVDALRQAQREMGPRLAGVILDLRGNLGGLLDQSIAVSDVFLPEGVIVSTRGRHRGASQFSRARDGDAGEKLPMVVLVNGSSASAAEIVAAALQDNGRAVLIGTTSFGKGSVQTVIGLPNDGELVLTWARFHAPSGYPLADLGVRPTICTSGGTEAPTAVLARVRGGRAADVELAARWEAADHDDAEGLKALRATCAPESAERDSDLALARALLADRTLHAAALPGRRKLAVAR